MNEKDYISLIHKQLAGDITPEERIQLENWMQLSEANEMTYDVMRSVWENTEFSEPDIEIDLDQEFALLEARIDADEIIKEETPVVSINRRRFWSIAAGIALLVGVGATYLMLDSPTSPEWATVTTTNSAQEIKLADGSLVHLNANSTLKYPEKFTGAQREVELEGEGFFDIAKDASHPFIVHTPHEDVTVLGTSFNVRAYETEKTSVVAVATGKVKVTASANEQILLPNEKAIVERTNGSIDFEQTTDLNESAWHTKVIKFADTRVPQALTDIEDYYGISFEYDTNVLGDCFFTATFDQEELAVVLETVATVLNVDVQQKNETTYQLSGGGCE